MFAASVVDFGSFTISNGKVVGYQLQTADGGYYMAYNMMAVTAVKDSFIEWEDVLTNCMKTLEYSDSFVSTTNQASNEKVALANQPSNGWNYVIMGKQKQESGHYEPKAERCNAGIRKSL